MMMFSGKKEISKELVICKHYKQRYDYDDDDDDVRLNSPSSQTIIRKRKAKETSRIGLVNEIKQKFRSLNDKSNEIVLKLANKADMATDYMSKQIIDLLI
jgi:hypothetical protein